MNIQGTVRHWAIASLELASDTLGEIIRTFDRYANTSQAVDTSEKVIDVMPDVVVEADTTAMVAEEVKDATIEEKVVLVKLKQKYQPAMSAEALYQAAKRCWRGSQARLNKTQYVFAIYDNTIVEVYERTGDWYPVEPSDECPGKRYEFDGKVATDLQHYIGKRVDHYYNRSSNPVNYVNV